MLGRCTTGPCAAKAFCAPLAPHHSDRDEKRGGECASFHSPPLPVWPMSALDRRHLGAPLLWHSVPPRCDRAHHPHPLTKRQGFSSTFLSTAFSTRSDHVSHRPSTVMSISSSCDPRNDDAHAGAHSHDRVRCRRTSHARHQVLR